MKKYIIWLRLLVFAFIITIDVRAMFMKTPRHIRSQHAAVGQSYANLTNVPVNKIHVQRIAAKAIIINNINQILILREASTYQEGTNVGKYGLPGGRVEVGESYFDGLKREIREETGLDIVVDKPVFVGEWFPIIKDIPHQIIGIFFACKPLSNDVALSLEHDHYVWINPQDVSGYDMTSSDYQAIQTWQKR